MMDVLRTVKAGRWILKNTIIILTSNLLQLYPDGIEKRRDQPEARAQVDALLKTSFRPEFLNRLDEIVYYKPLSKTEIAGVVDLMLESLVQRLAAKQLRLAVTDAAKQMIVDGGYDPVYGARPPKRYIQQKVETLVARDIIQNDPALRRYHHGGRRDGVWRWCKRKRRIRRPDISPGLLFWCVPGPDETFLRTGFFQCGTAIMGESKARRGLRRAKEGGL